MFSPQVPLAFAVGIGTIAFIYWRHLEQKVREFDAIAPLSDAAFMVSGWLILILFEPGLLNPLILSKTVALFLLCLVRSVSMKIEISRTQPLIIDCDFPQR